MINYQLEEVLEITGLKIDFARKCLKHLREYLKPHESRGEFNRLLYNQSGLAIWDNIKQMKEHGLSIPEMQRQLEDSKTPTQTNQQKQEKSLPITDINQLYLQKIIDLQSRHQEELTIQRDRSERAIKERDQEIKELVIKYQALDTAIKMLPEGKSPEQIRKEWEVEQKRRVEIASIIAELKTTSLIRFRKKKILYKRLEELTGLKPLAESEDKAE